MSVSCHHLVGVKIDVLISALKQEYLFYLSMYKYQSAKYLKDLSKLT
ncbi:hypothetical protein Bcop_1645 [Bacteroides coprosuis DSM 18011]|uniref:Uncharacterized protein n=1 Tax=Bacteroides coprosuis DSM 18011 TaxID=679937 RepID=F3ZQP2_9BACE|nr:hypothetical protein Bcop_1645 [Bacteroides coprosuis DSM 18011]